ncbi:MAG: lipid-A-disaccharide synthase [Candidatus Brocadia sp. AMX2]|uniref:lipid-A-disaccharide synthase n=1 Tax=Candidatus Brocadia sp. AMX2 TaxID=2293635 RepID=UPI000EC188C1|nr:lipid-A-disaccharide synthase [Candidatus Brocadia sp. AMX2]MBC6930711.1 lipid-A-disaccharide synthase [Candidatus Brocadia sp.]KAA0245646.1 MAG: lipid-A-disaccharide synthase [Candidatus Brocadia sp. AMX2]MCE7865386.1 lipid-A-disaccharide synthase [Candidatus Brocadia sp. AMX2]MCQ3915928.1 lipid-A-disaccharide synthase [Candidatus Brocadia sp.]MDL1934000.1 lipid-A-disaccharide synthase [Candidatus Brocadia sp. AMX2]
MSDIYKIFISAGESSGDIHGANLMRCLMKKNPSLKFYGLGKENMKRAGLHCLHDMSTKSLMWLHVLKELTTFLQMKKDCIRFFQQERPDAVILIDYCGFNFHLARAAKKLRIPVIYYICPQLWAHAPWRVKKMKKLVDKLIVVYPFEKPFYESAGIPVTYVGHPLFDEISKEGIDEGIVSELKKQGETIVSFLPGSRKQEIVRILPLLLQSAARIQQTIPSVKFLVSCGDEQHLDLVQTITRESGVNCKIMVGNVHEVIKASDLCIAGAGTITLQIAYYLKPMIIVYKISPFAYFIARPFLTTPYIGLVNTLAHKMIVPELLMCKENYAWIADQAIQLLNDPQKRQACIHELSLLMDKMGKPGASEHAAEEVLKLIWRA